jgi:histidyl-tRNA synthetase
VADHVASKTYDPGLLATSTVYRWKIVARDPAGQETAAAVALIVGEQEAGDGTVVVRDLRTSEQETVARADVVERVRKVLRFIGVPSRCGKIHWAGR